MSADNGIYILATSEGQYRVAHVQAIDSLWWSHLRGWSDSDPISTRIVEIFGKSKTTRKRSLALHIADKMSKDYPVLEYGIVFIIVDKSWGKIVSEAKELAFKELEILYQENELRLWDYDIEQLKAIAEMKGQRIA